MRLPRTILAVALLLCGTSVYAADQPPAPLLPKQFAGWKQSGTPRTSTDPVVADPANASLLNEYRFTDFASATYLRDNERKLTIKAIRFSNASGAYGAFTYYRSAGMPEEKIGDQGASLNRRVLFYRGSVLVDAVFDQTTAMSAAELRELSGLLPMPPASDQILASFLSYLPQEAEQKSRTKYVLGPVGLQKINAPIPSELVDFPNNAEVATTTYDGAGGDATLTVIYYPTPQMATSHLQAIEAAEAQNAKQPGSVPALAAGMIYSKRTGPLLVLVTNATSRDQSQAILSSVNYEANVTWNEKNPFDKRGNIGTVVVNALLLAGAISLLALIAGLGFGGVRIVAKRFFPNNTLGRPDETEFISLHLEEPEPKPSDVKVS